MPRPTRWKGCVNGLKGRVRACFICPPIRLTSTPSKWPAPKLSSSCARLKRALWKHSMRRLLRPYKLFLRAMLKASSSMSDSVYDPYGNRYIPLLEPVDKVVRNPKPLGRLPHRFVVQILYDPFPYIHRIGSHWILTPSQFWYLHFKIS